MCHSLVFICSKMARGMPRRKCLEYTVLLGLVQIVITFGVVWFLRSAKTAGGPDPADKRLLLSVDYSSNRNGGLSYESSSSSREVVGGGGGRNRVPVLDTSNFMAARQTSTAAANSNEREFFNYITKK